MRRKSIFKPGFLFAAPEFADPVKTLAASQIFSIVRAFILSVAFVQVVQIVLTPERTGRLLVLLLASVAVGMALLELTRRGHVRLAAFQLVLSLWLLISILSWITGGFGARAAWGYFIVVFIAGMLLGRWLGLLAAAVCSVSTLAIALGAPIVSPDPVRFWLINTLYLLIVHLLQNLAGFSTREALAKTGSELHERLLAQAALFESEKKHRELINSLPFCVFEADLQGRFTFVNQTALEWFGYSRDEFLTGLSIVQVLVDKDVPKARENIKRIAAGEDIAIHEYQVRRKDGRPFTALIRTRPIFENGLAVGLQGSLIDISDRKQAEKDREQVISLLKATLESTADGILVVDSSGKIANFNQRFVQMWRIPEHILASRDDNQALDFVMEQLAEPGAFLDKVHELYDMPEMESFDLLKFKDGRFFERYSRPQLIAGHPLGRVWSFRDISERKRAEEQRQRSEGLFRTIFEASPIGIELYSADGTQINANRASLEMFGIEFPEDLSRFNIFDGTSLSAENKERLRRGETVAYLAAFDFDKVRALKQYRTQRSGIAQMDYVITPLLGSGAGSILGYLLQVRDVTERIRSEAALQESEYRYRTLFEAASDSIFVMRNSQFFDCNSKTLEMFGCTREQILGKTPDLFSPSLQPDGSDSRIKAREKILAAYAGSPQFFEWVHCRADGTPFDAEVSLARIDLAADVFLLAMVRDISVRKRLEEQLRQAQKMEAIGILAGGVAHDFNNILSTIVGYSSLLQMKMQADSPFKGYIERILTATERAANLTNSLLAFSRKQEIELLPLDINDAIYGFHKILARLIGEDIDFSLNLASQSLVVDADVRQIEQVLMNLANNSRDAMPRGGKLTIRTAAVVLDEALGEIPAGSYAVVTVADSGTGMSQNIQSHVFEPFFTTKEVGKGTGLGLAIVYGIIRKHRGFIHMDSVPGQGTTFSIYLPLNTQMVKKTARRKRDRIPTGSETILLIEDDPAVRQVTRSMLEEFGYTVLEAANGIEGQSLFQRHQDTIQLVLCDLIMPKMNGRETLAEIQKLKSGVKAIFMSGYTADIIAGKGVSDPGMPLLLKPLNPASLLKKIRVVLDG